MKSLGVLSLVVVVAVAGCARQSTYQSYMAQAEASDAARKSTAYPGQQMKLADVKAGLLPKDYKKSIDAKFANTLIDPDSRKIEFLSNPYGGLVCGTVNAKNRMGGYTGKNVFYATFNKNKELISLESYSDKDVNIARGSGAPGDIMHVEYMLLKDCGAA